MNAYGEWCSPSVLCCRSRIGDGPWVGFDVEGNEYEIERTAWSERCRRVPNEGVR